jgi:truncated hemoglobin YjbI
MEKMIENCIVPVPDEDRTHWVNKLQEAEEIMINDGELTDEILDNLNIANNLGTNKDE